MWCSAQIFSSQQLPGFGYPLGRQVFGKGDAHFLRKNGAEMVVAQGHMGGHVPQGDVGVRVVAGDIILRLMDDAAIPGAAVPIPEADRLFQNAPAKCHGVLRGKLLIFDPERAGDDLLRYAAVFLNHFGGRLHRLYKEIMNHDNGLGGAFSGRALIGAEDGAYFLC